MTQKLTETESRILGALVEKQLTTPEYYPLTLNALVAACNQKSNRDPVVSYDEKTVETALEHLRDRNLVYVFYGSTSRVPKYKHMLPSVYELEPSETAVLCVLMLRGAQTLGEIRGRTERLYDFRDLGDAQETIDALIGRDEPLIAKLERQPGQKDARYAHLLCGEEHLAVMAEAAARPAGGGNAGGERIEKLEQEVESLRTELAEFKETFEEFRKQFE
jgi:uncharacterized protein YceH (UPF0502 family)